MSDSNVVTVICDRCGYKWDCIAGEHDNCCPECKEGMGKTVAKKAKRKPRRRSAMDIAAEACGLKKVRGALGGVYYE